MQFLANKSTCLHRKATGTVEHVSTVERLEQIYSFQFIAEELLLTPLL